MVDQAKYSIDITMQTNKKILSFKNRSLVQSIDFGHSHDSQFGGEWYIEAVIILLPPG